MKVQQPASSRQTSRGTAGSLAAAAGGAGAPSLQHLCMAAAEDLLGVGTVCAILGAADLVRPSADQLRAAALAWLAAHLPDVLGAHPAGLQQLSFDCMLELLQHPALVSSLPGSAAASSLLNGFSCCCEMLSSDKLAACPDL